MPFTTNDIVFGIVIPAAVVMAFLFVASRIRKVHQPFAILVAIPIAFCVGYYPLSLGPVVPESHWHWIPTTVIVACVVGGLLSSSGRPVRAAGFILATLAAGWFLVPTWADLIPTRSVHLVVWTIFTAGIAFLLSELLTVRPARATAMMLFIVCSTTSVVLVLSGNLRFAQMALIAVGAALGTLSYIELATLKGVSHGRSAGNDLPVTAWIGLPVAVLLCALLLAARVNSFSSVPLLAYVLPPLALIVPLKSSSRGDDTQTNGAQSWKSTLIGLWPPAVVCLIALLIAIAFAVMAEG